MQCANLFILIIIATATFILTWAYMMMENITVKREHVQKTMHLHTKMKVQMDHKLKQHSSTVNVNKKTTNNNIHHQSSLKTVEQTTIFQSQIRVTTTTRTTFKSTITTTTASEAKTITSKAITTASKAIATTTSNPSIITTTSKPSIITTTSKPSIITTTIKPRTTSSPPPPQPPPLTTTTTKTIVTKTTNISSSPSTSPSSSRYNIVDIPNPETNACPKRLVLYAPKLKDQNCRGDINMIWSVASYQSNGIDPINYEKATIFNPIQTAADIKITKRIKKKMKDNNSNTPSNENIKALFVADPFLVPYYFNDEHKIVSDRHHYEHDNKAWMMFTEILDSNDQKGKIGLHISNNNLKTFKYKGIVIEEPWHLSFPYIIPYKNEFYMTTSGTSGILSKPYFLWLYKAIKYPYQWKRFKTILDDQTDSPPVDPAIIMHNDVYYLFTRDNTLNDGEGMERLFYNTNGLYEGKYIEHPMSKKYNIRQSGRIIFNIDSIAIKPHWIVFHHTDKYVYGLKVMNLTTETYGYDFQNKKLLLAPIEKSEFASNGMHTLSLVRIKKKQWIGVCDGWHDDVDLKVMGCLGRGSKATRCQKKASYYHQKYSQTNGIVKIYEPGKGKLPQEGTEMERELKRRLRGENFARLPAV